MKRDNIPKRGHQILSNAQQAGAHRFLPRALVLLGPHMVEPGMGEALVRGVVTLDVHAKALCKRLHQTAALHARLISPSTDLLASWRGVAPLSPSILTKEEEQGRVHALSNPPQLLSCEPTLPQPERLCSWPVLVEDKLSVLRLPARTDDSVVQVALSM